MKHSLYTEKLPLGIRENLPRLLWKMHHCLLEVHLPLVSLIIADHPTQWHRKPSYINLYVIGDFRSTFRIIQSFTKALAPLYSEDEILLSIFPIREKAWIERAERKTRLWRHLNEAGIVLLQTEGASDATA